MVRASRDPPDVLMLATFRRGLNTWPARLFFLLLAGAFVLWGVGDWARNFARGGGAPVSVAGRNIDMPELQEEYRRALAQASRATGQADPSAELRRAVAIQTVGQLVTQAALDGEARDLRLAVPDVALREAVYAMPAFHTKDGKFDRATMDAVLRNNGMSEQHFLDLLRRDLMQQQLLQAVAAGAAASGTMAHEVFAFQHEQRIADAVDVPLATAPEPPAPTQKQLERWWANHPDRYSTPGYRKIKAIVLAPDTVAKDVQVSEDDLKAEWEQHKGEFNTPERRSVDVLLAPDEAKAEALAKAWRAGADWAAIQAEAAKVGATPVELTDAAQREFPAPELGAAVFAAPEGTVPAPVKSALGWHVLKVTKITPGHAQTFEQARDALHARVVADKAADLIYDRANRLDNLLSAGSTLETLPGDVGVAAVSGTLDAQGMTPAGTPAPIPGPAVLRTALVKAAFEAKQGDPPKLIQAPNAPDGAQSFFAVTVDAVEPPKPRPFADVAAEVRKDWTLDARRHEQEVVAAGILTAVKDGKTLAEAAGKLPVHRLPPASRAGASEGVPPQLVAPLFALKKGEPTMVETPEGFIVAVLTAIEEPDPGKDPIGFGEVRDALARAVSGDMQQIYASAVRDRAAPRIDPHVVDSLATPGE
jgi:peptidyl-prolyl cis-trans isomerase D